MRFDYEGRDWPFLASVMNETSERLSRTRRGVSDTSASEQKRPLLLAGEALRRQSADNERRVIQWIMETRNEPAPADSTAVRQLLFTVADLTNVALLPAGRLRTWEIPYPRNPVEDDGYRPIPSRRIPPDELVAAIEDFSHSVHSRWPELATNPVPLAAWVEWHLNPGPLHPFYDGCGRVSRSFSALLLVRASRLPPLYQDRDEYFAHAEQGPTLFAAYFNQCIEASERLVKTWESQVQSAPGQAD
jgi:hypothetical protein